MPEVRKPEVIEAIIKVGGTTYKEGLLAALTYALTEGYEKFTFVSSKEEDVLPISSSRDELWRFLSDKKAKGEKVEK